MGTLSPGAPRYYVGPSGWSYPDWAGIVYPQGSPKRFDALSYIAKHFNAVEVNTSFYRPMSVSTSESWIRRVADFDDFLFTAKLHQSFTHRRQEYSAQEVRRFQSGLEPIHQAGRLGCILMQFPWSFRRTSSAVDRLRRLADDFRQFKIAAELRHDSWDVPETRDELREMGVGYCNIDQPKLPHCIGPTAHATGPVGYVRFHGRRTDRWFAENVESFERYNYLYGDDEIREWLPRIHTIGAKCPTVFVFCNNHYRGQGPANALQLRALLDERKVNVPPEMIRQFPGLQAIDRDRGDSFQETLFDA